MNEWKWKKSESDAELKENVTKEKMEECEKHWKNKRNKESNEEEKHKRFNGSVCKINT